MRIEVLVGNEDPVIFPLTSSKVSVGSSENCDIVIDVDGISRKHIYIFTENDQYFVTDQGSSNGTFINEERLIPGRKTEFTSFFPVRLGDRVLLSLLSDEDDSSEDFLDELPAPIIKEKSFPELKAPENNPEGTRVLSLNELNKVRTEDLVLMRNTKRKVKRKGVAPKKKKKSNKPSLISILSLGIVVAAAVYQFYLKPPPPPEPVIGKVGEIITVDAPPKAVVQNTNLIPAEDLTEKSSYGAILDNMKCITDVELHLCRLFPPASKNPFGVAQVGLTLHVMLDGTPFFEEARTIVKPPTMKTPEALKDYEELVRDTGIYLFLLKYPVKLDLNLIEDKNLSFAFFEKENDSYKIARVLAIKPEVYNKQDEFVKKGNLRFITSNGKAAFILANEFYTTY